MNVNNIAAWNIKTQTWNPLGINQSNGLYTYTSGANSTFVLVKNDANVLVRATVLDISNQLLYVGGYFPFLSDSSWAIPQNGGTLIGFNPRSANSLVSWSIPLQRWIRIGNNGPVEGIYTTGIVGTCNAMALDTSNSVLYFGGNISEGTDSVNNRYVMNAIGKWDIKTTRFVRMGPHATYNGLHLNNSFKAQIFSISLDVSNELAYIGGFGVNFAFNPGYSSTLPESNLPIYDVAVWNNRTGFYSSLGTTSISGTRIFSMHFDMSNNKLYVGGTFITASGNYISRIDIPSRNWEFFTHANSDVNTLVKDNSNNLYMGGSFTLFYDSLSNSYSNIANRIAYIPLNNYTSAFYVKPLGGNPIINGIDGSCNQIVLDSSNRRVYIGGNQRFAYDTSNIILPTNYISAWDLNRRTWNGFGKSLATYSNARDYIYNNLQFSQLVANPKDLSSNGTTGPVTAIALDSKNQQVYVSGNFTGVKDSTTYDLSKNVIQIQSQYIAKWNLRTTRWSTIANNRFDASNGTNGEIKTYVFDSCKNVIYCAGKFTLVSDSSNGDASANNIAVWDVSGKYWSLLGTPLYNGTQPNTFVNALAMDSSNQILYVGGEFRTVYDNSNTTLSNTNYIASWDAKNKYWSRISDISFNNGVDGSCNALVYSNNTLYMGGNFRFVSYLDTQPSSVVNNYLKNLELWYTFDTESISGTTVIDNMGYYNGTLVNGATIDTVNKQAGTASVSLDGVSSYVQIPTLPSTLSDPSELSFTFWFKANNSAQFSRFFELNSPSIDTIYLSLYSSTQMQCRINNTIGILTVTTPTVTNINNNNWYHCTWTIPNGGNGNIYINGVVANTSNYGIPNQYLARTQNAVGKSVTGNYFNGNIDDFRIYKEVLTPDKINIIIGSNTSKTMYNIQSNYVAALNTKLKTWTTLGSYDIMNGTSGSCYALHLDNSRNKLYVGGLFSNVSDARGFNIITANNIASWDISKNKWDGIGSFYNNGTNGVIVSTVYDSCKNIIYCGGNFNTVYDASNIQLTANNIAAWNINGKYWTTLGSSTTSNGVNSRCNALAMDSSNQILYVGGSFTSAKISVYNLVAAQYVAAWNNNTKRWSPLGGVSAATNGLDFTCNALAYDNINKKLYVGGDFTTVKDGVQSDISASKIAIWDIFTNKWSTTGGLTAATNGLVSASSSCNVLTMDYLNNCIYVGGTFTTVRDTRLVNITVNNIAKWDISRKQWAGFGGYSSNGTNRTIYSYAYDSSNNIVYCGGTFTQVYDSSNIALDVSYIAAWDINQKYWSRLGGLDASGGVYAKSGTGPPGQPNVTIQGLDIDVSNQILYVGGYFSKATDSRQLDISLNNVAAWDIRKKQWSGLGGYSSNGTNGTINAYAYDNSNNILYCGGNFTQVYDLSNIRLNANNIAAWNVTGQYWSPLGINTSNGTNGPVKSLNIDISNQSLYVGGSTFTIVRDRRVVDISMNNTAKWNISRQEWNGLGGHYSNGTNGVIYAYAYDNSNNIVYCGGNFTQIYDSSNIVLYANDIAAWNISGQYWSILGTVTSNGTNGYVKTMEIDISNQILYVGGLFSQVNDNTVNVIANNVAIWNIVNKRWYLFGVVGSNGTNGLVNAIVCYNDNVYLGGSFTSVSGEIMNMAVNRLAIWNITNKVWSRFGSDASNGLDNTCNAMILNKQTNSLYVAGNFTTVYDSNNYTSVSVSNIASWDIKMNRWRLLGGNIQNGTNGTITTYAYDSINNVLYCGGNFTLVFDVSNIVLPVNNISAWNVNGQYWKTLGTNASNGTSGPVAEMIIDTTNQLIYVGGNTFTAVYDSRGTISANNVAIWNVNNKRWNTLGTTSSNGVNAAVYAFDRDISNQILYVGGNFTKASDSSNVDISTNYIASWNIATQRWSPLGLNGNNGTNSYVNTILYNSVNSNLYVCGNFTKASDASNIDLSINYIGAWNTQTQKWSHIGTPRSNGTNGIVNAATIDMSNQEVFIGGTFNSVRDGRLVDISINNVAKWNISRNQWAGIGGYSTNGTNGIINSYVYDNSNNIIYCGGNFTKVYDTSNVEVYANYIAIWNVSGQYWSPLGTITSNGTSGAIKSLDLDSSNQSLYVGGTFNIVRDSRLIDLSMNNVAKWNIATQQWSPFGISTSNGVNAGVYSFYRVVSSQILYVGGNFTTARDSSNVNISTKYIASWDIASQIWSPLGLNANNGTNSYVNAIIYNSVNSNLYVGGNFTTTSDSVNTSQTANRVASWNTNTKTWSLLGTSASNGTSGIVNSLHIDMSNQEIFIGGTFNVVRDSRLVDILINNVTKWNISRNQWVGIGGYSYSTGSNNIINSYVYDNSKNIIYCGGNFTQVYDTSNIRLNANYIAIWNVTGQYWSPLGTITSNGTSGEIKSLELDSSNQVLYVGGTFNTGRDSRQVDITINNVAKWNIATQQWSSFGTTISNGVNSGVYAIDRDISNQILYVGGNFTTASDAINANISTNYIAALNIATQRWSALGLNGNNGTNSYVNAVVYNSINSNVYVGGNFTTTSDSVNTSQSANRVASWNTNTSKWCLLGTTTSNGTSGIVNSLDIDMSNQDVFIGGAFNIVRDSRVIDISINNVAKWNISRNQWVGIGGYSSNGTNGNINTYVYDNIKNIIYCGGNFTKVYDASNIEMYANYIAIWNVTGQYWSPLGTNTSNGTSGEIKSLKLDSSNQALYVGGTFNKIRDSRMVDFYMNNVAKWNIATQLWNGFGNYTSNGTNGSIYTYAYDSSANILYCGGNFTQVYDISNIGLNAYYIAALNVSGNYWSLFGTPTSNGTNGPVKSLEIDVINQILYVGGNTFNTVKDSTGNRSANNIASWNIATQQWSSFGTAISNGVNGGVYAIDRDISNQILYVGGNFTTASDSSNVNLSTKYIASWNIASQRWYPLGLNANNGTNSYVNAVVYNSLNSNVYVGGNFTTTSDSVNTSQTANRVASWNKNTTKWSLLGTTTSNGINGLVNAIDIDMSNQVVYVGGSFTIARDSRQVNVSIDNLAKFDISRNQWSAVRSYVSKGPVNVVVYYNANGNLYVGGNAGDISIYNTISDASWSSFIKMDSSVNAIIPYNNNKFYIGGTFTKSRVDIPDASSVTLDLITLGNTWVARDSARDWYSVAISSTGQYQTAVHYDRNIYTSTDFGVNWTQRESTRLWNRVSISSSGEYQTATVRSGQIYTSSNSGVTWTARESNREWNGVAMSSTGEYQTAVVDNGQIYTSSDFGVTWTARDATRFWYGISISSTGQYQTAISSGRIYLSYNYGVNWTPVQSTRSWFSVSISSTGKYQTAVVKPGNIFTSDDFGVNWTSRESSRSWYSVSISSSGQYQTAVVENGQIYISADYGVTWTAKETNRPWKSVSMSSTGKYITATGYNIQIYTNTNDFYFFRTVDTSANNIAIYGPSEYVITNTGSIIQNGVNSSVYTFDCDISNQILYVGGNFTTSSDSSNVNLSTKYIASWNIATQRWSEIGLNANNGTNNYVNAIIYNSVNNNLYVGGIFTATSDSVNISQGANRVASWNTNTKTWSRLGTSASNGTNNVVNTMDIDTTNQIVYIGGSFNIVRDRRSYDIYCNNVVKWNIATNYWVIMSSDNNSTGANDIVNSVVYNNNDNTLFVGGNFTLVQDGLSDKTANYVAIWNNASSSWSTLGTNATNGLNAQCNTLAYDSSNQILYVGGNFTTVIDTVTTQSTNYNAAWNRQTNRWSIFGDGKTNNSNGTNGSVSTVVYNNNKLYVGGNFTTVRDGIQSDPSANYVAIWNNTTSTWSTIGTNATNGTNGNCNTIAYDNSNQILYVGGNFGVLYDTVSTQNSRYNAGWNTQTNRWSIFGSNNSSNGTNGSVNTVVYNKNKLYVGGNFTTVQDGIQSDPPANYVAIWNNTTSTWSTLGTNATNGTNVQCNTIAYDSSTQILYIGGSFTTVKDALITQSANYNAAWNTQTNRWSIFGSNNTSNGTNGVVNSVVYDNNKLYVGGNFTLVRDGLQSNPTANDIAIWNTITNSWSLFGISSYNGTDNIVYVLALDIVNNKLYVGGNFTKVKDSRAIDISTASIASWDLDNNVWYLNNVVNITSTQINSLTLDYDNQKLYVGGVYTLQDRSNNNIVNNLAMLDISTNIWVFVNNYVNKGYVNAVAYNNINGYLYVGGNAGDVSIYSMREYSEPLFLAMNSSIYAIISSNTNLYIGGSFTSSNNRSIIRKDISVNNIAIYDTTDYNVTTTWSIIKNGVNGAVNTIIYNSVNNLWYVGGNFTTASDSSNMNLSTKYIASWNNTSQIWLPIGAHASNGTSGVVNSLALDSSNQILYVGGIFGTVQDVLGNTTSENLAKWNIITNRWDSVNNYQNIGSVNVIAYDNNKLYIGGNLGDMSIYNTTLNNESVSYKLLFNFPLYSIVSYNSILYIGGTFTKSSYVTNVGLSSNTYGNNWSQITTAGSRNWNCVSISSSGRYQTAVVGTDATGKYIYLSSDYGATWIEYTSLGVKDWKYVSMSSRGQYQTVVAAFDYIYTSSNYGVTWVARTQPGTRNWNSVSISSDGVYQIVAANFYYIYISIDYGVTWNIINQLGTQSWSSVSISSDGQYQNAVAYADNIYTSSDYGSNWSAKTSIPANTRGYIATSSSGQYQTAVISAGVMKISNDYGETWTENATLGVKNWYSVAMSSTGQYQFAGVNGGYIYASNDYGQTWVERTSSGSRVWTAIALSSSTGQYMTASAYGVYLGAGDYLYTSNNVTTQSDISLNNIAVYDTSANTISRLGTVTSNGTNNTINAIAINSVNNLLYVGGQFTATSDASNANLSANTAASWNMQTNSWSRLGSIVSNGTYPSGPITIYNTGTINSLIYYNKNVYISGQFISVSGEFLSLSARYIASWNTQTKTWGQFGTNTSNGMNDACLHMIVNKQNNKLYVCGNFTSVNDSRNIAITANRIVSWDLSKNQWAGIGAYSSNGTNSYIYASVYDSCKNIVYCGGTFTIVYDSSNIQLSCNNIAAWNINGQYWSLLGSSGTNNGTNGQVASLAMDSSNQILYVGGQFTLVKDGLQSDPSANYIAAWNVSTQRWSTLGGNTSITNGLNNYCNALAFDSSNQKLYAGGTFTKVRDGQQSDPSANYIAVWNKSTNRWSTLGSLNSASNGLNGGCSAIAIDNSNNCIYVGGSFTSGSDFRNGSTTTTTTMSYIGGWSNITNGWFRFGSSSSQGCNNSVSSLAFDPSNQFVYVAGSFTTVNDSVVTTKSARYVAYWNIVTQRWLQFGTDASNGVSSSCYSITLDSIYKRVYVTGTFTTALDASSSVAKSANYVVYWDLVNNVWSPLGTTSSNGLSTSALTAVIDNSSNLFVSGYYATVRDSSGNLSANNIARWNPITSTWSRLGSIIQNGTNNNNWYTALDNSNQVLYVGGLFTAVSDASNLSISANYIAAWNIVKERWSPLGIASFNGTNNTTNTLVFDNSNNRLYVGGAFTLLNDRINRNLSAGGIAYWNPVTELWNTTGVLNGLPYVLFIINNSFNLYLGGDFSTVTDSTSKVITSNTFAILNTTTNAWYIPPNTGTNGAPSKVNAIVTDTSNNYVYVGGLFGSVTDSSNTSLGAAYIAAWNINTQRWQKLGQDASNGLSSICYSLQYDSSNSRIYVSGNFTTTSDVSNVGQSARYIAYWNTITQRWSPLGTVATNGLNTYANSMIFDGCGNLFVAGNNITTSYDISANNILYWTPSNSWARISIDGLKNTQNGTNGQVNTLVMNNSTLYIGGAFTTVNDVSFSALTSNYVSSWNINSQRWVPLGGNTSARNGLNNSCFAMVFDNCANFLYVGGNNFTKVSDATGYDLSANNLAIWNVKTNTWWPLGSSIGFANNGITSTRCNALAFTKDRQLFIGGLITAANDIIYNVTTNNALIWNPSTYRFSVLGGYARSGFTTYANAMIVDSTSSNLYIGGQFTSMNDGFAQYGTNYNAVYNISSRGLRVMGDFSYNGLNGIPNVFAMNTDKNILYMGGKFTKASDRTRVNAFSPNIAAYDISNNIWLDIDNPTWGGVNGEVLDMIYDGNSGILYVAGAFGSVSDSSNTCLGANYLAVYNTNTKKWGRLGSPDLSNNGTNGIIRRIAFDDRNNKLYVGGDFTTVYDSSNNALNIRYIASLNFSTNTWSRFGNARYNDLNSNVVSMNYSNTFNDLFVFGNFTNVTNLNPLNTYVIDKFATFYF